MAQALHVWKIRDRFSEQIPVYRVIDPFAIVHGYKMDGILFAGDAADALHTVPQPLTQRISKKPGESDLPADER